MSDPYNPRFEVTGDAFMSPEDLVRAFERLNDETEAQIDEDRGLFGLAGLVLAGVAGWAALRHFRPRVAPLVDDIKQIFANPKKFGIHPDAPGKIRSALDDASQVVLEQPWAHAQLGVGDILENARLFQDPDTLKALNTILEITRSRMGGKYGAHASSVQKVAKAHLVGGIPQDASGMGRLTLGDLLDPNSALFQRFWKTEQPGRLGDVQNVINEIVRIPGLSESIKLANWSVDPGLFAYRGGGNVHALVDIRNMMPSTWLTKISQAASGTGGTSGRLMAFGAVAGGVYGTITGRNWEDQAAGALAGGALGAIPTRYMARAARWASGFLPTEMTKVGPSTAILGPDVAQHYAGTKLGNVLHTLVSEGRVHPVYATGQVGEAVATGVKLGRRKTPMGTMAYLRQREAALRKAGVDVTERYIQEKEIDPEGGKAFLLRAAGKLGFGPQYKVEKEILEELTEGELIPKNIPQAIGELLVDPAKAARQYFIRLGKMFADPDATEAAVEKVLGEEMYAFRPGEGIQDWASYLLHRVGGLLQETLNINIRPSTTPWELAGRWVGGGVAGLMGLQALRYTDYAMRETIGTGPISAPLQLYAGARNIQQHIFAAAGIQQGAEYLENLMPGLVDSPASRFIRSVAVNRLLRGMAPLGGTRGAAFAQNLATRAGFTQVVEGVRQTTRLGHAVAGAAAFTQLTDITQSPVHLASVFRGETDVPVRESRFWALGIQPFTGGRVLYHRPHLIPSLLGHAREKDIYGSEGGYWANQAIFPFGTGIPVPENWFGLRPLLKPYDVEKRNYFRRPYPLTAPMGAEIPLIGPIVASTLGEIVKPTQRWHQWATDHYATGAPSGAARALGVTPIAGRETEVGDPSSMLERTGKQIDLLRDFIGMPGFMLGALKRNLTGSENFNVAGRQLQTAGTMTGMERPFYEMELGGMLGMTELFRRFLPHRRREIEEVNPVVNTAMPSWMPGVFSGFEGDRGSFLDFHKGDPYSKIPWGEARLPGPGYEALHRLHSGVPGVYDAYDRWKILRDVAPTSQAFRHYDTLVRSWARVGALAKQSDAKPLEEIYGRSRLHGVVKQVLDGDTVIVDINGELTTVRIQGGDAPEIAHSRFEASLPDNIAGQIARRRLEAHILGREVSIAPHTITTSMDTGKERLVGRVESLGMGGRNISQELAAAHPAYNLTTAQTAEIQQTRSFLQQRFEPYPFTRRIFHDPFRPVPRTMRNLTTGSLTAINTAIKQSGEFSLPEKVVGNIWERVSHVNLPGPLNWPVNKLFPQRDALEYYRMQTQGTDFAEWSTPIQSFVKPWMQTTIGVFNPSYVPSEVRRQRQVEAGFDVLQYMKMKDLSHRARRVGYRDLSAHYKTQSLRTMSGVIMSGNRRFVRSALPRSDRGFYTDFAAERDPARRREILKMTSPQFGAILKMTWGGHTGNDRQLQLSMINRLRGKMRGDWAGWHPDVPMSAMKVKTAQNYGWDIHDVGLTHRDEYRAEFAFDNYIPTPFPDIMSSREMAQQARFHGSRMGLSNINVTMEEVGSGSGGMRISVRRDPMAAFRRRQEEIARARAGMRF